MQNSGLPTLPHLPALSVSSVNYNVPSVLGWFLATPPSDGVWIMPPNVRLEPGSDLWIRNAGPGSITIEPAPGDSIDGPSVVPAGYTCLITVDFTNVWKVAFAVAWNAAPLPPVTGSSSFTLSLGEFIVGSTSPIVISYFPWLAAVYGATASAYLVFCTDVPGPDYTLQLLDGATVLAQQIVVSSGTFMLPLAILPSGDTKLTLRAFRNQTQSLNPRLYAVTLTLLS